MKLYLIVVIATIFCLYHIRKRHLKGIQEDPFREKSYVNIITEQGYSFEEHKIITEDGYINTAWKITNNNVTQKIPVLITHGLLDNCYSFLSMNKTYSLPYLIADEGYEVWMMNTRGSTFSYEHIEESKDSNDIGSDYWDFTFTEIAKFDLKAHISYVKWKSNSEKVIYIGHSQGAFQLILAYSMYPEFLESSIESFISIGTVAKFIEIERSFPHYIQELNIFEFFQFLGIKNMLSFNEYSTSFNKTLCEYFLFICEFVISSIIETEPTKQIDYKYIADMYSYEPGGTSIKNLIHWLQALSTHYISHFDYGKEQNIIKYGKEIPNRYNVESLKDIKFKTMFVKGRKDPYIPKKSIDYMKALIPQAEFLDIENYNHLDYILAKSAKTLIYDKILKFIK